MAYGRPGKFSLGMLGRVCLAVTVGFMLAEPIVLKVFEDSIEEQQYSELSQQKKSASTPYQNQIAALETDLKTDAAHLNELKKEYTGEADRTSVHSSAIRSIYEMKKQNYDDAKQFMNLKLLLMLRKLILLMQKNKESLTQ
ncbi:MAG: DUF4407 domain-containing protein [Bacteroidetes bacterium]|nr:DUF4407 domain-containing protein [Bacteroidota bacterium]